MKRDPNDPRLPLLSEGEWRYDPIGVATRTIWSGEGDDMLPILSAYRSFHGVDAAEANGKLAAASKDLLACVFGLLTNFPELGTEAAFANTKWDEGHLHAWLHEQAPYWRDALKRAGVELERAKE